MILEGKAIYKETETVITYEITDDELILTLKKDDKHSFRHDVIYWDFEEKNIKLKIKEEEKTKSIEYPLRFFTDEESFVFIYSIRCQQADVKNSLHEIIIGAITDLENQEINKSYPREYFPFKNAPPLYEMLSYEYDKFTEIEKAANAQSKDDIPLKADKNKSNDLPHYQLVGSFLAKRLSQYKKEEENDIKIKLKDYLRSKWIIFTYAPSDFCYIYNRLRILFSGFLGDFSVCLESPEDIIREFDDNFEKMTEIEVDSFPLMNFADDLEEQANNPSNNANLISTKLYYLLKNSNYIYHFNDSEKKDQNSLELKKRYQEFTNFLMDTLEKCSNKQQLWLCFRRFKFLFFDGSDANNFEKKAEEKYQLIMESKKPKNQTLQKIKKPKFDSSLLFSPPK